MAIKIIQLLCSSRHAVAAIAYDPAKNDEAEMRLRLIVGLALSNVASRCGVCGSTRALFETGETRFESLEAATPYLVECQRKNFEAREFYDQQRRTAKNN